jgi:hypothetical protein
MPIGPFFATSGGGMASSHGRGRTGADGAVRGGVGRACEAQPV